MLVGKKEQRNQAMQRYIHHDPTQGLELPPMEDRTIVPPTQNADAMIHLGAFTGLRRGELLALLFTDIDWSNKEIIVTTALTRFSAKDEVHRWRWEMGHPKTKRSVRRVALSEDILST